jgi:hypothetical protein
VKLLEGLTMLTKLTGAMVGKRRTRRSTFQ